MTSLKCPLSSTFTVYLMMLALFQVRHTSGEENYKKGCVENLHQMVDALRSGNKHYGIYDYFGNPLDIHQFFNFSKQVKVFHFKMINATSQNDTVLDTEKPCCQWNTKDCDIFVWYRYYFYLVLPPLMFHIFKKESQFLPQSLCLTVPTLCEPSLLQNFGVNVMNDSQGVFFRYVPMWYEGKPYGVSLHTLTPFHVTNIPRIWTFTLAKNIVILGIILLGNLLVIQVIKSENKILIFILKQSQKRQKRLTEVKLFTWCLFLLIVCFYSWSNLQCTVFLMSHEEYFPDFFLPDCVIALIIEVFMFISFIGQYPLIYGKINKLLNESSNNQQQIPPRWRRVIRFHAISLGWAGPVYSIQVFGVAIVYLGIYFIKSPLEAVTYSFCYILQLAAIVVILHEVYLMLRHPKNCCICSNHATIFFCIAIVFIFTGMSLYVTALLNHYKDVSPLFDSTKLMEYVISTLLVAALGYFGKKKVKDWYEAGDHDNNEDERREDVGMLPY